MLLSPRASFAGCSVYALRVDLGYPQKPKSADQALMRLSDCFAKPLPPICTVRRPQLLRGVRNCAKAERLAEIAPKGARTHARTTAVVRLSPSPIETEAHGFLCR
jgi:hypothetical protein